MANSLEGRNKSVHSVHRAISVLQVLARLGPTGVTEIAAELSVHKSTVFRPLATLESRGLVEQNSARGRYQLGYGVVQLAAGTTKKHDLSPISRPVCQELAHAVGETVNVVIDGGEAAVSIIDQVRLLRRHHLRLGGAADTDACHLGRQGLSRRHERRAVQVVCPSRCSATPSTRSSTLSCWSSSWLTCAPVATLTPWRSMSSGRLPWLPR